MSSHGHSGAGLIRRPPNARTSKQKGNCNASWVDASTKKLIDIDPTHWRFWTEDR
jgi:hypothetical protein